jgi:hypothetical protein
MIGAPSFAQMLINSPLEGGDPPPRDMQPLREAWECETAANALSSAENKGPPEPVRLVTPTIRKA